MASGIHKTKLFINYRREDTAPYAGRLYDRLTAHFGKDQVFIDIDQIEPGEDFVEAINRKVGACDIAIVSIGPNWLGATDASGKRRLDDAEDFVRMEIVAALERGIRVIPVLVGGARMPRKPDLPEQLAALARRNAIELSETRFHADVNRLIEAIAKPSASLDDDAQPSTIRPVFRKAFALIGIALLLGCSVWLLWLFTPRHSSETRTSSSPATVVRPAASANDLELVRSLSSPAPQNVSPQVMSTTIWNHNGSIVVLKREQSQLSFFYRHVRSGLQGIIPNEAALFEGVAVGDHYSGKARRFKKGFPPIEYEVSGGPLNGGKVIELTGKSPKRDESGRVTEYVPEILRFEYIGPE